MRVDVRPGLARLVAQDGAPRRGSSIREIIATQDRFGLPGVATQTMLALPETMTYEEWEDVGVTLARIDSGRRWWVGDWINYGERRYGERYSQGMDVTGMSYESLNNCVWIARRFTISRRRENLSWSHHEVVAKLDPELADALLDRAESERWDRKMLREAVKIVDENASAPEMSSVVVATVSPPHTVDIVMPLTLAAPSSASVIVESACRCHCHSLQACGCEA